ncbi:ParB/RepB/Spo0J family partition protein (plasmid) [Streptomyces sp. NBC_01213]|uniref:ParB/RepB/Spo0J family partition protein n=1 Tax=Streptomyces sp. NBC_01213 TaxID=2903776 RepID=UPI002F90837C|nr:ParB/RepB/Spo0J family partition protein [Streptomyces sp. NBC_01213]
MSKRDQLGRGTFRGSARRNAIDRTIRSGDAGDTAALTDLPVPAISDNPDNPRNHLRNLEGTIESVREVGVILPIVVGTVDTYVRSRPDRADDLASGCQYVVVDGHRRLEAARQVGLATIPVRVDDARLSTDERLLESAFIANYHREGMTDLEEAHALKQLVDYYGGSQTKACKRLSMSASTLSSKLSLLKLSPELQKDLMTGERKTEHVRNLSKLAPEAQKAKATERAEAAQRRSRTRHAPVAETGDFHGVNNHEKVTANGQGAPPDIATGQDAHEEAFPEQRYADADAALDSQLPLKKFPYHDGVKAGGLLLFKMASEERDKVLEILLRDRDKRQANVS